jgi:Carboxypeptidase regulatory-like domain
MRRVCFVFAILSSALLLAATVHADRQKKGTSVLTGVVLGPDDRPVPHASISYQSSSGDAPHAVRTDSHGHFIISKLPADNYDMRASANGIFSDWEKNIPLRKGQAKSVTLRLIYAKEMPKASKKNSSATNPKN